MNFGARKAVMCPDVNRGTSPLPGKTRVADGDLGRWKGWGAPRARVGALGAILARSSARCSLVPTFCAGRGLPREISSAGRLCQPELLPNTVRQRSWKQTGLDGARHLRALP